MTGRPRTLVFAAALALTGPALAARAQTVSVMNAPPASTFELVLNTTTVASETTDRLGDATVSAPPDSWRETTAASIYAQECPETVRVIITQPGTAAPAPGPLCDQTQIEGAYWVQSISSLVVDLAGTPSVRLRQGRAPAAWLSRDPEALLSITGANLGGLVVFGGGGLGSLRDSIELACGNAGPCEDDKSGRALNAGLAYWITSFLGAEAGVLRPPDASTVGGGIGYEFDTAVETEILTLSGLAGVPLGRVRLFGQAGMNRHRAKLTTTQTVLSSIVLVDGSPVTIPGGTHTFALDTEGWGLMYGGGLEVWFNRVLGLYGQFRRFSLEGAAPDEAGTIEDQLYSIGFGMRLRVF
jgi:hypothetical protein